MIKTKIDPEMCRTRKTVDDIDLDKYYAEWEMNGERIIAIKEGNEIKLQKKTGSDATHIYPEIVKALKSFNHDIILDGEVVIFNSSGVETDVTVRSRLRNKDKIAERAKKYPAMYIVFDVLFAYNANLENYDIKTRKEYLKRFYEKANEYHRLDGIIVPIIYYSDAKEIYEEAKEYGNNNIILKPKKSPYKQGYNKHWFKILTVKDDDIILNDEQN